MIWTLTPISGGDGGHEQVLITDDSGWALAIVHTGCFNYFPTNDIYLKLYCKEVVVVEVSMREINP